MGRIETKGFMSGPLTSLSSGERRSVLGFYGEVARLAKGYGIDIYLPHEQSDPVENVGLTDRRVCNMNEARIKAATVMIAELTRPSLGVGSEMVMCWSFGTQIIVLCERERLDVLREDSVEKQVFLNPAVQAVIPYKDPSDGLQRLRELFDEKGDDFKHKIDLPPIPSAYDYFTKWAEKLFLEDN